MRPAVVAKVSLAGVSGSALSAVTPVSLARPRTAAREDTSKGSRKTLVGTLRVAARAAKLADMELLHTRATLPRVEWLESVGSTNDYLKDLIAREGSAVPVGTLVATGEQTAGKGRAGRQWVTPPDTAVACSVLMPVPHTASPGEPALAASWLPLITGSAVTAALQRYFPAESGARVGVKWPNDVHVRDEDDAIAGQPGKKLCGILCELISPTRVIIGMGVNLFIPEHLLPTERATSLRAAGADLGEASTLASLAGAELADEIIAAVVTELQALIGLATDHTHAARTRVLRHSLTLGSEVRVHLPGGEAVDGFARSLADDGSLVVDLPTGGELTVSAGDVEHLR